MGGDLRRLLFRAQKRPWRPGYVVEGPGGEVVYRVDGHLLLPLPGLGYLGATLLFLVAVSWVAGGLISMMALLALAASELWRAYRDHAAYPARWVRLRSPDGAVLASAVRTWFRWWGMGWRLRRQGGFWGWMRARFAGWSVQGYTVERMGVPLMEVLLPAVGTGVRLLREGRPVAEARQFVPEPGGSFELLLEPGEDPEIPALVAAVVHLSPLRL